MWEQEFTIAELDSNVDYITVWCTTSVAAEELFEYLADKGWCWNSRRSLQGDTRWGANGYLDGGAYWLNNVTHTVQQSSTSYAATEHDADHRFVFHGKLEGRQLINLDDLI